MARTRKFLELVEEMINRNTNGGHLVNDVVVLVKGYKSKQSFKELSDDIQSKIESTFNDTDLNKRIVNIKPKYPTAAPNNSDNRGVEFYAEVAVELAPGLPDKKNSITIPVSILEPVGEPEVPDSVKYDNKVQIKPRELDEEDEIEQTRVTQQGDSVKKSETSLSESYTSMYMS